MVTPITSPVIRRVLPDAFWSLANNVLGVLSSLVLIKIIARLVSAEQYGAASLALGVIALISQFIANPLLSARLRIYFDHMREGRSAAFSASLAIILLKAATLMSGAYLLIGGGYYLAGTPTYILLLLPALMLIFVQPQLSAMFNLLEAHRKYRSLTIAQTLSKLLNVPILAVMLWASFSGSVSIVASQALALLLVFVFYQFRMSAAKPDTPAPDAQPLSDSAVLDSFGWSLYAFNLFSWIMSTSDRFLIDHYSTAAAVGVYVINYGFWSLPFQILNGWIDSFTRPRLYLRAAGDDHPGIMQVMRGKIAVGLAASIAGTFAIYWIGKPLALWILGERYWQSETLMMVIASAHIFFVLGHMLSTYFLAIKKTRVLWVSSLIAAGLNVGGNIALIPHWGILGAAYTTLLTYLVWSLLLVIGIFADSRESAPDTGTKAPV